MLITQYVLLLWPGKHLPSHGIYHMHDVLPASETIFPHFLWEDSSDTALFHFPHVSGHMWEMKYRHKWDGFNTCEWAPNLNGHHGCESDYPLWL